ncbi:MAG: hypothetical protein Kow0059_20910 [Candidatus Sumerlaeia bacterium]
MRLAERDIDVLVAGHTCLDIIPRFPGERYEARSVFRPGGLVTVEEAAISNGGPVANTGLAIAKLGLRVALVARVGDDWFGRLTLDLLREKGNVEGIRVSAGEHSSYTIALAPPGIDRIFFHFPGTNHTFCSADVDAALCGRAKVFHLGYPPLMRALFADGGAELIRIYETAAAQGTVTSIDMALPDPASEAGRVDWAPIIERLMPLLDIYLPSLEETFFMVDRQRYQDIHDANPGTMFIDAVSGDEVSAMADRLLEWGGTVIAQKCGHRGYYVKTAGRDRLNARPLAQLINVDDWAGRELWTAAMDVAHIASATGSGDSSIAGFLSAVVRGHSLEETIRLSQAVAYQNLQALDALSGIKDWAESLRLARDFSQPLVQIPQPGPDWVWRGDVQMWEKPAKAR